MAMIQSKIAPFSFDGLMNATCNVLIPNGENPETGYALDAYGQSQFTLDVLVTGATCRLYKGRGREKNAGEKFATMDWQIALRPIIQDDAGNAFRLRPRHWLNVTLLDGRIIQLNLKQVNDPGGMGHHLECVGTEVITQSGVNGS